MIRYGVYDTQDSWLGRTRALPIPDDVNKRNQPMTEKLAIKIAWMLPRSVAKWCFYRVLVHATQGKFGNTEVPGMAWETAANRWEVPNA